MSVTLAAWNEVGGGKGGALSAEQHHTRVSPSAIGAFGAISVSLRRGRRVLFGRPASLTSLATSSSRHDRSTWRIAHAVCAFFLLKPRLPIRHGSTADGASSAPRCEVVVASFGPSNELHNSRKFQRATPGKVDGHGRSPVFRYLSVLEVPPRVRRVEVADQTVHRSGSE